MSRKYARWNPRSNRIPESLADVVPLLLANRRFQPMEALNYGDHGLDAIAERIATAIESEERIALYADYDVDGTMSCVSWVWFLRAIGYENFVHYIPCRFTEGYGLNLKAMEYLIDKERAQVIITMDTGITANDEARYCRERGVTFLCTDHHVIQQEKMPDALILNPKLHPEAIYQDLCGCGITFVLLRKLGQMFPVEPGLWTDLMALAGMATICDVVTLNGVNHRLARLGAQALLRSQRPVLRELFKASQVDDTLNETDIAFRLGPRINAVGRLEHASKVIRAFTSEDPAAIAELISEMNRCNDKRREIQKGIVVAAESEAARFRGDPILFLGGDWHPGVVGIAASKIAEKFWRPTWLFQRGAVCKGSARCFPASSEGSFNVTAAMQSVKHLFMKFGGHQAAGGFAFDPANEGAIREALNQFAEAERQKTPHLWETSVAFDCELPAAFFDEDLVNRLEGMRPFGHGFSEPLFLLRAEVAKVEYYRDKRTGEPKHTAVHVKTGRRPQKIMFFNDVMEHLPERGEFLVNFRSDQWQGRRQLSLFGVDAQS